MLFGGLHRLSWYHSHLEVSRNAPFPSFRIRALLSTSFVVLQFGFVAVEAETLSSVSSAPQTARVVTVYNPEAISAYIARPDVVRDMVARGITNLTHKAAVSDAWLSLVSKSDVVGIKVYSVPGANSGTRPSVVAAVVEGLLNAG